MQSGVIAYNNIFPEVERAVFLAPGSFIIGAVYLAQGVSIWYNVVLRGDVNYIEIGEYSNIQDNSTIHADSGAGSGLPGGLPTIVGKRVTVGHNCVLHACTIEDYCAIGMGAIVMDGALVCRGSIIGAGALIPKNMKIPPYSVAVGVPAKITKTLSEDTLTERKKQIDFYYQLALNNKSGCKEE
jgi:carbonic anhydrase/acetyltransferase-like protein (isoleucine patch superfamily)